MKLKHFLGILAGQYLIAHIISEKVALQAIDFQDLGTKLFG
tara:strand:- start:399 stop:521 length:123 start_codon:yes stop_codon:yes gene_type:complete